MGQRQLLLAPVQLPVHHGKEDQQLEKDVADFKHSKRNKRPKEDGLNLELNEITRAPHFSFIGLHLIM